MFLTERPDSSSVALQAAFYRRSLSLFVQRGFLELNGERSLAMNWHIHVMTSGIEKVLRGDCRRLLITVPPRHLKSHIASICLPAWVLAKDPTRRIIAASYSNELARKFSRDCRALMQSDWYAKTFRGTRLDSGKLTETEIQTSRRGFRYTTSVGGTLTGRGGDLIILDDAMKPEDAQSKAARAAVREWFTGTLLSRLDDKAEGAIIVVMQRLHVDDLAGFLLATGGWHHINIPAIAEVDTAYDLGSRGAFCRPAGSVIDPSRETSEQLEALKREMGSTAFSAQYQQAPIPAEGQIVKWGWFARYDALPPIDQHLRWIISWDTAMGCGELNDYSVGIVMLETRKREVFVVDLIRGRMDFPTLVKRVRAEAEMRRVSMTLIESAGSGLSLAQQLYGQGGINVVPVSVSGDKASRLQLCAPAIEAGRVLLPTKAPWLSELHDELVSFPSGSHDDQVDALSQGINYLQCRPTATAMVGHYSYR